MLSKLVNKFYKIDDIEVRADKFVSTYSRLTKTEIEQEQKKIESNVKAQRQVTTVGGGGWAIIAFYPFA